MTVPQDKQGYLGDLNEKTVPELRELLQRQENILKKQRFLQSLPDKGVKVKTFAETLKKLIAERDIMTNKVLPETEDMESTPSTAENDIKPFANKPLVGKSDKSTRDVVNLGGSTRDVVNLGGEENNDDKLSACLERVTLSADISDPVESDSQPQRVSRYKYDKLNSNNSKFINSYERVIKSANERPKKKKVFKPNSTLNIATVQELPDAYKFRSRHKSTDQSASTEQPVRPHAERQREESAVCLPDYKHDHSLLIPVEESLKLVEEQRKKHEELMTRQAAERLASRLHIRLDDYNPEGTNMNYRVQEEVETDSDDEPEQEGYED